MLRTALQRDKTDRVITPFPIRAWLPEKCSNSFFPGELIERVTHKIDLRGPEPPLLKSYVITCAHRARMIVSPFWLWPCAALGEDVVEDVAVDIGQAEVTSLEAIGELCYGRFPDNAGW